MPTPQVDIKSKSADWRVNELGFPEAAAVTSMPAAGKASPEAGAHTCFYVEKTDLNTLDIVRTLSHEIGVAQHEIGYAGRKDKWAVTRQWISAPRIESWPNIPGTQCLEQMPRRKKLPKSVHPLPFHCCHRVLLPEALPSHRPLLCSRPAVVLSS